MSSNLFIRQAAARTARATTTTTTTTSFHAVPRPVIVSHARLQSTSGPTPGTVSSKPAKGPSGPEAEAQGSDQRGKATTYALPIVAVSLVLVAVFVRMSSKDSKQNAVNVGIGTEGASKLKGSKAKGIENAKASADVDNNISKNK